MKEHKPIGELNGFWSMLFRVSLCAFPLFAGIVIAWATWVTKEIFAHEKKIDNHQTEYLELNSRTVEVREDVRDQARRISVLERIRNPRF